MGCCGACWSMLRSVPYWSVLATIVACVGMSIASTGVAKVDTGLKALLLHGLDADTGSSFGQIGSLANITLSVTFGYGAVRACVYAVCVHMRVRLRREGEGGGGLWRGPRREAASEGSWCCVKFDSGEHIFVCLFFWTPSMFVIVPRRRTHERARKHRRPAVRIRGPVHRAAA